MTSTSSARRTFLLIAASASAALALFVALLAAKHGDRQSAVRERGATVMPFDLDQTTHIFTPNDAGGVQRVVADEPGDQAQVALIRQHLREEARRFQAGDFADPAAIHGQEMPGLALLQTSAGKIDVRYSDLPDGGEITYRATDAALVGALHDWFAAQLSDHGHDARSH